MWKRDLKKKRRRTKSGSAFVDSSGVGIPGEEAAPGVGASVSEGAVLSFCEIRQVAVG